MHCTAQHIGLVAIRKEENYFHYWWICSSFDCCCRCCRHQIFVSFNFVCMCPLSIWLLDSGHLLFLPAPDVLFLQKYQNCMHKSYHTMLYLCSMQLFNSCVLHANKIFLVTHKQLDRATIYGLISRHTHWCERPRTVKRTNGPMPMICAQGTKSSIKFRACTNIQYGMRCIHTCTYVRIHARADQISQ